jgi:hypothetical protein
MTSMDFLLAGKSVKVNPYLRAFAASGLPERMRGDDNFSSWTNIKGKVLRKEIAEASAAASRIPRAVAKARGVPAAAADGTGADDPLGDGEGVVLFDLCSGKGFTSIFLAHRYPKARILMFDFNRKMNLKHLPSLAPNVTFHRLNLYDDQVQSLVSDAVIEHGDRGSCIVGVHLCGDLSRRAGSTRWCCRRAASSRSSPRRSGRKERSGTGWPGWRSEPVGTRTGCGACSCGTTSA